MSALHPVIAAAARGELPDWARFDDERRAHMARVADLMQGWAEGLGLTHDDCMRWRALGFLHDAVKGVDADELRLWLGPEASHGIPDPVLHGPAAALKLRAEGITDDEVLDAVAWHTLGHPVLTRMGRALYVADFLEPGRDLLNDWRAGLRARMPHALDEVLHDIVHARILHLVERDRQVHPQTMAFWNRMAKPLPGDTR